MVRDFLLGDLVKHAMISSKTEFALGIIVKESNINGLIGVLWCDGIVRFHSRLALKAL